MYDLDQCPWPETLLLYLDIIRQIWLKSMIHNRAMGSISYLSHLDEPLSLCKKSLSLCKK